MRKKLGMSMNRRKGDAQKRSDGEVDIGDMQGWYAGENTEHLCHYTLA